MYARGRLPNRDLQRALEHVRAAQEILRHAPRNDFAPITGLPWVIARELETIERAIKRCRK